MPEPIAWDITKVQDTSNIGDMLSKKQYKFVYDEYGNLCCVPLEEDNKSASNGLQFLGLASPGMKIIMQPTTFGLDADTYTDPASIYNYARNNFDSLPKHIQDKVREAGSFLVDWGINYSEILLKKAPLPPNVQLAIAVGFFMINVCQVATRVQKRRTDEIARLQKEENYKPEVAIWEANGKVNGWLAEEIGEVMIKEALDTVLQGLPLELRDGVKAALITAWGKFVDEAKSGKWERNETSL